MATVKAILTLASAPQAQRAFTTSLALLRATVRPLELISTTTLLTAYIFSPKHGRHPYLIITGLFPLLGIAIEKLKLSGVEIGVLSTETVSEKTGGGGSAAEVEINGEVIRGGLEDWRVWGLARGALLGVGFALGLVGIWGDGV